MELPQLLQQYASMSVSMHVRPCPNLFENCKELYVVCTSGQTDTIATWDSRETW